MSTLEAHLSKALVTMKPQYATTFRFRLMSENVKVVSNFLAYDTEGNVTGIAGDMVHIFNKNESAVHDSPYFKKLEGRKNIVLMGDSLGDLQVDITLHRRFT